MPEAASALDLWPADLKVEVPTPASILRMQASLLNKRMNGVVSAEVVTIPEDGGKISNHLQLRADVLGFSDRILTARHTADRVYPVTVSAEVFSERHSEAWGRHQGERIAKYGPMGALVAQQSVPADLPPQSPTASSATEFTELVREVLRSKSVRATLESLIARVNESSPSKTAV